MAAVKKQKSGGKPSKKSSKVSVVKHINKQKQGKKGKKKGKQLEKTSSKPFNIYGKERQEKKFNKNDRKRKRDSLEQNYEEVPRKKNNAVKQVGRLPIKKDDVWIPQYQAAKEKQQSEEATDKTEELETTEVNEESEKVALTTAEQFASRREKLNKRKERIAALASRLLEQPEENIGCLKELRVMLDESDPSLFITVRKLVAASLLEVFKDIIPGYKIRPPTEKERSQKVKKETKILWEFEALLIKQYRHYLQVLASMTEGLKSKKKCSLFKKFPSLSEEVAQSLGILGLRCLCDLLVTQTHFNHRSNITVIVVSFMSHPNEQVSELCCESVRRIFKEDKLGEASLDIVRQITKLVKERNYSVNPQVLRTFLSLKIKDVDLNKEAEEQKKKKGMTYKEKKLRMSRRERKKSKHMEQLEKDLLETRAEENKDKKQKLYTEITKQIFLNYFGILKKATNSVLIPAVLEGLAKFAHLINIEFFDDLFKVFHQLIETETLSYRERLHCVQTVFTILSGQGEVLNVDPLSFYTHLYNSLFHLTAGVSSKDVPIALKCLDIMLVKRKKKVSKQRVLAFTKRMTSLSLQLLHNGACAALLASHSYMQNHRFCEVLLDSDCHHGSGVYLPELEEPEHCNAENTSVWELHTLRRHYHSTVRKLSGHILQAELDSSLPSEVSSRSPEDLFTEYDPSNMAFKPSVPPPKPQGKGKQSSKRSISSIDSLIQEALEDDPGSVDFSQIFSS